MAKEKQKEIDAVNADITKVIERPVFTITTKPFKFVGRNGY